MASLSPASLSPASSAGSAISAESSLFLFELIVGDLHGTAIQVGAVAIMASAALASGEETGFQQARHLVHDDTSAIRLALRFAAGADVSAEMRDRLDRLYLDIQQTGAALKPLLTRNAHTRAQRELLRRLSPALRRVALGACEAIERIEPLYRTRIDAGFSHDAAAIRQFLARAARGDRSDVGPDGVARLPALRQRRKSPRMAHNRPCLLGLPGGDVDAILVDLSREGLGLRCESPVSANQSVCVAFGPRRLEATVTRVEGDLVGLRLTRPLTPSDPLFKGG